MRYLIAETSWTMMTLAQELCANGTLLTRTDRPEDVPQYLRLGQADLLLLEADQLGQNGLALASLRAEFPDTPIALVASKPNHEQIASWLGAGADCIVPAEAEPEETIMRLQAVVRRVHDLATPEVAHGPLRIDLHQRKAFLLGCPIKLSPKLYELLEYIALRPGRLVTRAELLSHVYGLEDEPDARVFDVYICNLRACLKAACGAVDIETVRGSGFRFAVHDSPAQIAA
ncbi:winged-helix domain-containing protein [Tropicibacter naphthalenivorans]|uniref:Cell cycle response regulator CtrA n=1 Tax=Tropicibacter naphthalenivorans TaxID=441103 RepID=A0A0P1GAZ3_9RHOB|nr:response regulator transcription factor [Tropicibacter naphthalenivorans]CUH78618.1 Cell cycle response regulator CtrA [Tropicibacter naphthalenivorans]SMC81040.1 two-component system, cell cycle response regulator CtrA [Tropicibacter naphthalenivorans]